jgi:hypothetical protein
LLAIRKKPKAYFYRDQDLAFGGSVEVDTIILLPWQRELVCIRYGELNSRLSLCNRILLT